MRATSFSGVTSMKRPLLPGCTSSSAVTSAMPWWVGVRCSVGMTQLPVLHPHSPMVKRVRANKVNIGERGILKPSEVQ